MTRNRDLYLEDIFGCKHVPEVPIVDDVSGEIVEWICRCGKRHAPPEPAEGAAESEPQP